MNAARRVWRAVFALGLLAACALAAPSPSLAQDASANASASADPASSAIVFYQRHLSDLRHMRCRFTPSCSQYALDAIAAYGVVEGSARAADRLMRCNEGADSRYARGDDGLLSDPATGSAASATEVRAPDWLQPLPTVDVPPVASSLAPDRRARLFETLEFARQLEARGDCERASAELQRAGMLADTLPAQSWAFARAGDGYLRASQWLLADRAYLTAAMLTSDPGRRAAIGWAAALSRFDAGAFGACSNLLADPALLAPEIPLEERLEGRTRVATLTALCAVAAGAWEVSDRSLRIAADGARGARDTTERRRIATLQSFAARGRALPHRSADFAGVLSVFVPGAGQVYAGHTRDGLRHLAFNAALGYTVYALASNEQVPASVIVGSVALPFYVGNVLGARASARRFDREQRMRLLARAIEESSR